MTKKWKPEGIAAIALTKVRKELPKPTRIVKSKRGISRQQAKLNARMDYDEQNLPHSNIWKR